MTTLGEYLKARRISLKLTRPDVVRQLKNYGIEKDPTTLAAWEANTNPVPVDLIPILAIILEEKTPNRLFDLWGVVEKITGADIIRMLADADESDVTYITKMTEAHFKNKPK